MRTINRPLVLNALNRECAAEILKSFRALEFLIPSIAFPIIFYSIFGVLMGRGGAQAQYLLATFGVFAVMGPSMFGFGVGVAMERDRGWLDLKRVSPMPVWIYLASKLVAALTFSALTLSILYSVAGWFGGVSLPRHVWTTLLISHLSFAIPFSLLGLTIGFLVKGNGAVAITNIIFLGLAILGGLWMPIGIFPDWFQAIGSFMPSYHAGQIALLISGIGTAPILNHILMMATFTGAFGTSAYLAWSNQSR